MRRLVKWLGIVAAVLIGLPLLAIVIILIGANTGPGRNLIQTETASLTGGMVRIQGLSGRFPEALRVGLIQVSDAEGPYVTVHDVVLDWSPLKLLQRIAKVDRLTAAQVDVTRLPKSSGSSGSSGSFSLPVEVDLRRIHVNDLSVGAAVAGTAARFVVDGSGYLQTLTEGTVQLAAQRLDGQGAYDVNGTVGTGHIQATLKASEPAKGLISSVAGLPALGPIAIQASIDGPRSALVTQAGVSAGAFQASAVGTVDVVDDAADLTVKADAPAMSPAPNVSWHAIHVDARTHGPFTRPNATGFVRIAGLAVAGIRIGALNANVSGDAGHVQLHATVDDLRVPGPKPDLLAGAPVVLDASAQLSEADRPVTFALRHPLIALDGTAMTAGQRQVQAHLVLADLAPLAAAGGTNLQGHADLDLHAGIAGATTSASVNGTIAITGGVAPAAALIGPDGRISVAASMKGSDVTLSRLELNGRALNIAANGHVAAQAVDLGWQVQLTDLTAIQPDLSGVLQAKGHASGKTSDISVIADINADLAAKGYSPGHVAAHVDATGLPAEPHATVTATGTLLDAPLSLALSADRTDGTVHAEIDHTTWKSLQAKASVVLAPGALLPVGSLQINLGRMADLAPLLGRPINGKANITLSSNEQAARFSAQVDSAAIPGTAAAAKLRFDATLTSPSSHPVIDLQFNADGVSAGPAKGASARLTANGPFDAVALAVSAEAPALYGGPVNLNTTGTLDAQGRTLTLAKLDASWKQQTLRLLAPTKMAISDSNVLSIDRLRLGIRQAVLEVAGTAGTAAGSKLDLTASLRDLPADIAAIADPSLAADGTVAAEAHLTGTTDRPEGTVKLTALGVRLRQGAGKALPAANLSANLGLHGTNAKLDTALTAGPSHLTVAGTVPLSTVGPIHLKTGGRVDLTMLDPLLAAEGRRARGQITLDATVAGTATTPKIDGTVVLTNGDVTDYVLGAHVTDLAATVEANGDSVRLAHFSGKAGPGTLGGSGTISLSGEMPVSLHFTADNARPIASDLLTALINADLTVQGEIKGNLQAGGTLFVRRADIRIPDSMPASVAVLPVQDTNAPPPPPPPEAANSNIALNLTINAPEQVFIRGHGLNAELGGMIHITGTATEPLPSGGLHLRQGTLSVIGTTLNFTSGTIDFSGAGLADPSLNFVATSSNNTITATLTVSGTAKKPKITLSSVPELPQDEILAQLLFNTSTSKLSPLQLAQIAAALAQLSGATSSIGDPLAKIRSSLGLDRLTVGSDSSGNPTLQAGRYVARGVYLGAQQSASGTGSQATVQVDIARGLKLNATAGSGTSNATGSSSSADAASVGLLYQFEY